MKVNDIKVNHVYVTDKGKRKVLGIVGPMIKWAYVGRSEKRYMNLSDFANIAVEDLGEVEQ